MRAAGPAIACLIGPYGSDFARIAARLRDSAGAGFALCRYADGELLLAHNRSVGNAEWQLTAGMGSALRAELVDSLRGHWGEDFFFGFASVSPSEEGGLLLS
jgi:hypothetical protein